ncbi:MAG TPA: AMP-binding protein [Anaerolineales bacterium]|nr:AMP-binding protein [Anaerolineales bacterium]
MSTDLDEKLRAIIHHAYKTSSAIKAIMDDANILPADILAINDLEKFPITSKDRLVELQRQDPPFGGFLASPVKNLKHVFLSPGPLYEPHAGEIATADSIREMVSLIGFKAGDIVINTFGYHLIPTGLIMDQVLSGMGITVIPAGVGNADLQIRMMLDLKVTGFIGTPSWLNVLIQKAEENSIDFTKMMSLQKVLVSAEPLPPRMRQKFVENYGLKVLNAYGTAEFGFLAYNLEGGLAMRLTESSIIQIADPDTGRTVNTGESGEVVVTSFNETYPLIRLGIGDLAVSVDPDPGKSLQSERSIILVGRVGEAIKVRGMFVHPNQLRFAVGQVPGVMKFQGIVSRPGDRDAFTLKLVLDVDAPDQQSIIEGLSSSIRSACRITVDDFMFVEADQLVGETDMIIDTRSW